MSDFGFAEMQQIQKELQEKHKDKWMPIEPATARSKLLWLVAEFGEVIDIVNDINHLGLTMGNDNLIMNPTDNYIDWNNGMDITSAPLLTIPEYSDDLSQFDSFNNVGIDG